VRGEAGVGDDVLINLDREEVNIDFLIPISPSSIDLGSPISCPSYSASNTLPATFVHSWIITFLNTLSLHM